MRKLFILSLLLLVSCSPAPVASLHVRQTALTKVDEQAGNNDAGELESRIESVLAAGLTNRILSAETNASWQIMHAVIPYGFDLMIDTPDRGTVSAVKYAFDNGMLDGFELRVEPEPLDSTGRPGIAARFNPGSYIGQGHVDQWLAIFAMADIPLETSVKVGEKSLTLLDWARQTQWDVSKNPVDEYAWTLIALTHYFPEEPVWMTEAGVEVSWELLLSHELKQSNSETACGGTHRMAGIVSALRAHDRLGLSDNEVWRDARMQVEEGLKQVKQSRGLDGRLSSYYFSRPGGSRDLFAELSSAGHLFEFVALAGTEEQLREPWVEGACDHLCELLELTEANDLDCGALYHALHGLRVYQARRFP